VSQADLFARLIPKYGPCRAYGLNEERGAQQHFIELCAVLGLPAPEVFDPICD
jgi:hypothetical protein